MKYKRLFTFGCSYTKYHWSTWADIIARDTGLPYQNWAQSGGGNVFIHCSMIEARIKNNINEDDLVLVNWSSWHREDRVNLNGDWMLGGNIFNNNSNYNKNFRKNYHSIYNDIVKNATAIIAGNDALPIAFQSHMIDYETMVEYPGINQTHADDLKTRYAYYNDALPEKKLFDNTKATFFNGMTDNIDHHPDVLGHLGHAKQIYDYLGWELKQETIDYYNIMHERIAKRINRRDYWDNLKKTVLKIYPPERF